ncbi:MAG: Stp1/IreP family PP2C-type Ser/Thr phosphatase [Clostridiales bacterium]|nr:Stp1/IreP family PP2C-type Ser/Thr phosphatase [Clostridiales bacterium]MCF8022712.1 Stp1/IreP family PP2C-type Ser/Thr phosphatase [Clostridiales bacterium]
MKCSHVTNVGKVRNLNEDYYCMRPDLNFFAVADGMGGHNAGEVASYEAIKCIESDLEVADLDKEDPGAILKLSILKANRLIYDMGYSNKNYNGMGTTISACIFRGEELTVGNVGDSRCYLVRDSSIYRLTEDHSLVEELIRKKQITSLEARSHQQRNVLTRAVGTSSQLEVDIFKYNICTGDLILLCTDGLTEHVPGEEILQVVMEYEPGDAVEILQEETLKRGGSDNITLIVLGVE